MLDTRKLKWVLKATVHGVRRRAHEPDTNFWIKGFNYLSQSPQGAQRKSRLKAFRLKANRKPRNELPTSNDFFHRPG